MTTVLAAPAVLGTPMARLEGREKVTGAARYAFEVEAPGAVYAWPVQAQVARGTVKAYGTDEVLAMPGVLAVLTADDAPRLGEHDDPELLVLQSREVSYRGQVVALVVAETQEAAREAAATMTVTVAQHEHDVLLTVDRDGFYAPEQVNAGYPTDSEDGDVEAALRGAAHVVDHVYATPAEFNNPMEPHAATAWWDGDALLVHDSTQGTSGVATDLAALFAVDRTAVRVLAEHVGGGFGSKGSTRPNCVLAVMAAKVVGRPVRLALTRQMLFSMTGYRTPTLQRVRLGADADGRLLATVHEAWEQSSRLLEFAEQTTVQTRHMYASATRRTTHRLLRLDVPTPRWMRAPGEAPGMFALESALDELAVELGMDPVELRVRNDTQVDPDSGSAFSSRHLVECLRRGAERFGWAGRDPRPGARREGRWVVGTGVASSNYPVYLTPSGARVRASRDGRFAVHVNATDIGTGARTVMTQVAADALGVGVDRIDVRLADSDLPEAPVAGGSWGTASWGWAVDKACRQLRGQLLDGVPSEGIEVTVDTGDDLAAQEDFSRHAFGAHFAEARVDLASGEVRVSRMLGVFAAGRILNPRTARSQLIGGMTMGLSMALHEEGLLDVRHGDYANHDLATYHVAANADVREIDAEWLEESDPHLNPVGGKGIGEIGIVGSAAAVTNAIWHATGVRVRDLPATPDKLLTGLPAL